MFLIHCICMQVILMTDCQDGTVCVEEKGCIGDDYYFGNYCTAFCANQSIGQLQKHPLLQQEFKFCSRTSKFSNFKVLDPTTDNDNIQSFCKVLDVLDEEDLNEALCDGADCTEIQCRKKYCLVDKLENYEKEYICSFKGIRYDSTEAFCTAYSLSQDFNFITFCGTKEECTANKCCFEICKTKNITIPGNNNADKCTTGDVPAGKLHTWIDDLDDYCVYSCLNDVFVEPQYVSDVTVDDNIKCCQLNLQNNQCSSDYSALQTSAFTCGKIIDGGYVENTDYFQCRNAGGDLEDCTLEICTTMKCKSQLDAETQLDIYCDSDDNESTTTQGICLADNTITFATLLKCYDSNNTNNDQTCVDSSHCKNTILIKDCIDTPITDFGEKCDSSFQVFTTITSYCTAKYGSLPNYTAPPGDICQNPQSTDCTELQCCIGLCSSENDNGVCKQTINGVNQLEEYELKTVISICEEECSSAVTVKICDKVGGCIEDDCLIYKCESDLKKEKPTTTKQCGFLENQSGENTIQLFDNAFDFCTEKITNNTTIEALFRNDNLLNQDDCNYLLCIKNNESTYDNNKKCQDQTFVVYETVESFCDLTVEGGGTQEIAKEDTTQLTETQCNQNKCELDNILYKASCIKDTFEFVDNVTDYCTKILGSNSESDFTLCKNEDGSADVECTKCDYIKCLGQNLTVTTSICLEEDTYGLGEEKKYILSLHDFCYAIEQQSLANGGDRDFSLTAAITNNCDSTECADKDSCYEAICNNDTDYIIYCNDYEMIAQSVHCDPSFVAENILKCYSDSGNSNQIPCTNNICYRQKCLDDLEGNSVNICLVSDPVKFYTSNENYCDSLTFETKQTDYSDGISDNKLCGSECADEAACCKTVCEEVNNTRLDTCNSSDFSIITLSIFCTNECLTVPADLNNDTCMEVDAQGEDIQVKCSDCVLQQCREDVNSIQSNVVDLQTDIKLNPVCITNYTNLQYYSTTDIYCQTIINSPEKTIEDGVMYCGKEDTTEKNILCTNKEACFLANCEKNYESSFSAFCENTTFLYYENNSNGILDNCKREYELYLTIEDDAIDKTSDDKIQCCTERCLISGPDSIDDQTQTTSTTSIKKACSKAILETVEDGDGDGYVNATSFQIVDVEVQCNIACKEEDGDLSFCYESTGNLDKRDCEQVDCDVEKCIYDTNIGNNVTVCGNNGTLYASNKAYCVDKIANSVAGLEYILWDTNTHVDTQERCDYKNCQLESEVDGFSYTPTCLDDFEILENHEEFCQKHKLQQLDLLTNDICTDNCDVLQCDLIKCKDSISAYVKVCSPIIVEGNESTSILLTKTQFCDNTKQLTPGQTEADKVQQYIDDLNSCSGDCTEIDCAVINCKKDLDITNTCDFEDSTFNFQTKNNFCDSNDGVTTTLKDCSTETPPVLDGTRRECISSLDCCSNYCLTINPLVNDTDYICGKQDDFTQYTKSEYCSYFCGNDYDPLQCDDDNCTNSECDIAKCEFDTSFQVCDNYDNDFGHLTIQQYCVKFVDQKLNISITGDYETLPCLNSTGAQINCTKDECEEQLCIKINESYTDSSICLKDPQQEDDPIFFETKKEFCGRQAELDLTEPIPADNLKCKACEDCEITACDVTKCNFARCLNNDGKPEDLKTVCKPDYSDLLNKYQLCEFFIENGNTFPENVPCDGDCTQNMCDQKKCLLSNIDKDGKVCVLDTIVDSQFIEKTDFCEKKYIDEDNLEINYCSTGPNVVCDSVNNCCVKNCNDITVYSPTCFTTDYETINDKNVFCQNSCGDNLSIYTVIGDDDSQRHATEKECDIMKCTQDDSNYIRCDTITFQTVTIPDICTDLNNNNTLVTEGCGTKNCTQDDCDIKKCQFNLAAVYTDTKVCANNYKLYSTQLEFCQAKQITSNSITGNLECTGNICIEEKDCCVGNCTKEQEVLHPDSFPETCKVEGDNYTAITSIADYCNEKCDNDIVTWTPCQFEDSDCSKDKCCSLRCNSRTDYLKLCSISDNSVVLELADYCLQFCVPETNYFQCPFTGSQKDCVNEDCPVLLCKRNIQIGNIGESFCDKQGNFHASTEDFCSTNNNNDENLFICLNEAKESIDCSTETNCCQQSCEINNSNYTSGCDSNNKWYETVQEYCVEYCLKNKVLDLNQCDDINCNKEQCKKAECLAEDYSPVCASDYILYTKTNYCIALSKDENLQTVKCKNDNEVDENCINQISCDVEKCVVDFVKESDVKLCFPEKIGGNIFHVNSRVACRTTDGGNNVDLTSDILCEDLQCNTEAECCQAKCKLDTFVDYCSDVFIKIEKQAFCDLICPTTVSAGELPEDSPNQKNCEGGCQSSDCEKMKCKDNINKNNICLDETKYEINQFFTIEQYCTGLVENETAVPAENSYEIIDTNIDCIDTDNVTPIECSDSGACCQRICINKNNALANDHVDKFKDTCVDGVVVQNISDYCTGVCQNKIIKTCKDGDDKKIPCTECFKPCSEIFSEQNYTLNTVCFKEAYMNKSFYSSQNEYCIALEDNSKTVFDKLSTTIQCADSEGESKQCDDLAECRKNICLQSDFLHVCVANSNSPVKVKTDFCDLATFIACKTEGTDDKINCTFDNCCKQNQLVTYAEDKEICGSDGVNYSIVDFCTKIEENDQITPVTCDGSVECTDKKCCLNHCQEFTNTLTFPICGTDAIVYENKDSFCEEKCSNSINHKSTVTCETKEECELSCCRSGCENQANIPVLILENNQLNIDDNECQSLCREQFVIIKKCELDQDHNDCSNSFITCVELCEDDDDVKINYTNKKHCSFHDKQEISDKEKCYLYNCEDSIQKNKIPPLEFKFTENCENKENCTDCVQDICELNCVGNESEIKDKICASDGDIYNKCDFDCDDSLTQLNTCETILHPNDLQQCHIQCRKDACVEDNPIKKVCGSDGNVYESKCQAFHNNLITAIHPCPINCQSEIRETFCEFECKFKYSDQLN